MTIGAVSLSTPKPRSVQTKVIAIARTDNDTTKAWLPKGAVLLGVEVLQLTDAVTDTGSFTVGGNADADGVLAAFTMATTKVGLVKAGVSAGVLVGTKLTADTRISSTYTVGSSTAGGTGLVYLSYFVPGPGEGVDD